MKRFSIISAMFLLMGMLFGSQVMAQGHIELGRAKSAQKCVNVTNDGFTATFSFSSIDATEVNTEKGVFSNILMDGTYPSGEYGTPQLPAVNQLIAVPFGAKIASVEVKSYSTSTYRLADYGIKTVMPNQPSVSKSAKPEDIKFVYNEKAYAAKSFSQRPIATVKMQGTMRGIQIGALTVNPVAYNPTENTIMVYNDIEVEVRYDNYDKIAADNEFVRTFSPYFASIYKQMFNWRDDVYDQHPDLWQAPVKMLVIANRMFEETIQEWVSWKTIKGIYMDVNYTDEIGTTAAAIKTFIQNKYNQDAPTFLIIIGDKNQVPASATGSQSHCVTDLEYESVDGDMYPDIFHSRMPVETVAQLQNVLTKSLMYERYEMPDPSYLEHTLLIAGADANWNPRVGQPTVNYATTYYYNAEHGVSPYVYLHSPYTGCYSHLNTGVAFANYTAHGSNDGWADPQLSVSNVNSFTNEGKPFLAMGNCCEAADWGISGTCFGEAMIRANTKGAYAYIGSCPVTYWYEDYYFGVGATNTFSATPTFEGSATGVYDGVWMDDTYNTVASMLFLGNIAVSYADANGYQGSASPLYYWQAYHVLGDASIMPYRTIPQENVVSHMAIFPIGMPTYEVSAVPGSYVAISKDGVLHGVGLVDESGTIEVEIEPITSSGDVTICVTAPQRIPYIQVIPAAALEGPYIAVDSYNPTNAHVGEEANLSITFKNVGTDATNGITNVTLSSESEDLTLLNYTGSFDVLAPEATTTVNGFSFRIAEGVADGTRFTINVTSVCGSETWEGKAYITAGEAILEFADAQAGGFTPGETLTVTATFKNVGHYMATNAIATIASTSEYVSFVNDSYEVGTIDPDGTTTCVFNVTIDASCPSTEQLPLTFTLNADGGLSAEGNATLKNTCNVIFSLVDSYGDGWNGNKLRVAFNDGTPTQDLTIDNGNAAEYTLEIGLNVHVTLSWVSGSYTYECSFTVSYEDGTVITQASSLSSSWSFQFDCDCNSGSSSSVDPVTNLTGELNGNEVILYWNMNNKDEIVYHVYRNGIEIGQTTEHTYTDMVYVEMVYTYCVVAEMDGNFSVPMCIQIEFLDDIEENEANFAVYPNPVNGTLFVDGGSAEYTYEMYNGMGQRVAEGKASGNTQINVNGMAKGVYFLRLTSGTQIRMEKVVVE
ncbi:MAG: T9SS type A sorting domain-containing protein [Bacteroidales bacterium]|nr:T9SS type A sorting domain-containing protein [Bacteroidales bacterium]